VEGEQANGLEKYCVCTREEDEEAMENQEEEEDEEEVVEGRERADKKGTRNEKKT
jgi:hypothetical protein